MQTYIKLTTPSQIQTNNRTFGKQNKTKQHKTQHKSPYQTKLQSINIQPESSEQNNSKTIQTTKQLQ